MSGADERGLLDKYCITCHNARMKTGNLVLERLDTANLADHAELWEKIVRKLRSGTMPPARNPRPDKATIGAFIASMQSGLDAVATAKPNPGRPAIHRLNRV